MTLTEHTAVSATADDAIVRSPWPDPELPDVRSPTFLLASGAGAARPPGRRRRRLRTVAHATASWPTASTGRGRARGEGPAQGDILAILAPNSPEWLVACHGASRAGGVVSGLNPLWSPGELAAQLCDAGARFLATGGPAPARAARGSRAGGPSSADP